MKNPHLVPNPIAGVIGRTLLLLLVGVTSVSCGPDGDAPPEAAPEDRSGTGITVDGMSAETVRMGPARVIGPRDRAAIREEVDMWREEIRKLADDEAYRAEIRRRGIDPADARQEAVEQLATWEYRWNEPARIDSTIARLRALELELSRDASAESARSAAEIRDTVASLERYRQSIVGLGN